METYIKLAFATLATATTTILGGWDMALQVLLIAIAVDYASGLIKAYRTEKLSSEVGAKGIAKKIMILGIVVLAAQLDRLMNTESQLIRTAAIYFYVANEGLSILENAAAIGIRLPKTLVSKLAQLAGEEAGEKPKEKVV